VSTLTRRTSVELLILDLDGVLVDSQGAESRALWEMACRAGAELAIEDAEAEFRGKKMADCVTFIEELICEAVPEDFIPAVRRRCEDLIRDSLRPVDGVVNALARIAVPMCVASSSPAAIIEERLRQTRLWTRFAGRTYSAYDINSWKPEPGLFLHAASVLDAAPTSCMVVEDSLVGIQAGIAAGMRTLGFAEGQYACLLEGEGASTFSHMRDLPRLVYSAAADT
jgi:HAD superfamily hydrolase (TIGR01509 family)